MIDDYSLMVRCKEGDQAAQLELFHRYHNYLLKKFNILKKISKSVLFEDFEDFESEAFIYFLMAVKYTDLNKLTDPKHWKFLTPYKWFISNMVQEFAGMEKAGETLSLNDPVKFNGKTDGTEYVDYLKASDEEDPIPRQVIEKMGCESFLNTLNPDEKLIFHKMQGVPGSKPPTLLDLAKQFGISRPWMAIKVRNLKEKFRTFSPNWITN